MKRKFIIILLAMLSLCISVAYGEIESVDVSIVEFDIYVNDTKILTEESQYPALTYNNITYFPLTYDYLSALGLSLKFNGSEGLSIKRKEPMKALNQKFLGSNNKLGSKEKAGMADFKISVNGNQIDNSNEVHPILIYKNITYFPMTWRFAVDEFKWQTSWSPSGGLKIITVADGSKASNKNEETIVSEESPVLNTENEFTDIEETLVSKFSNADFSGKKFTVNEVTITESKDQSLVKVTAYVADESLTNVLNIAIFKRESFAKFLEDISMELSDDLNKAVSIDLRYEDADYDGATKLDVYGITKKYINMNDDGNYYISFPIAQFEYNQSKNKKEFSFWFNN